MNRARKSKLVLLATSALILAVSVSAFFAGRAFFNDEREAGAQRAVRGEDLRNAFDLDGQKPPFVGTLNGISFIEPSQDTKPVIRSISPKCLASGADGQTTSKIRDIDPQELRGSPMDFTPTYLPVGAREERIAGTACEDEIVIVAKIYSIDPTRAQVQIIRTKGSAFAFASAPQDRMEARTIAGKPAVAVRPVLPGIGPSQVIIRGKGEFWTIDGSGLPIDEVVKVAEGLKEIK